MNASPYRKPHQEESPCKSGNTSSFELITLPAISERKVLSGEELRDRNINLPLYEYANKIGEEGWELVNLNFNPAYGYGFLTFKRPKSGTADEPTVKG
ncbi:hypothetical protein [Phormidium sp. CCY1219]|uniref:hypothetical protein n=1 Tax=Phormidium sp. CCY1219 TaxID=2886104 RepID=UPI002D1F3EE8|nr:hypothetical protein [Phormidium sp. CCY1219]MEB3826958.1 hypothetical protein [Phormidium sp. CCY1219]